MPDSLISATQITTGDKSITVMSLSHVSPDSIQSLYQKVIEAQPDTVCLELDEQRLVWLEDRSQWESLNVVELAKKRQLSLLSSHLGLRIFQKRFGSYDNAQPGEDMFAAAEAARQLGANVVLADRKVVTTGLRAWRSTPGWKRPKLFFRLTVGTVKPTRIRPEKGRRSTPVRRVHLADSYPNIQRALIEERVIHFADVVRRCESKNLVAVVAHHLHDELVESLERTNPHVDLPSLLEVPPKGFGSKMAAWLLTALMVGACVFGFIFGDPEQIQNAAMIWFSVNGLFTAVAVLAAYGHIWSALAAAISSPIVSLNPLMAAGMIGAFVQLLVVPPNIRDIEHVGDDILNLKGWWHNRLARVALVFVFANLGSTIATFVALALFYDYL